MKADHNFPLNVVGYLARCQHGRLGVITNYNTRKMMWTGYLVNDRKKVWQSANPSVIGENVHKSFKGPY